MANRAYRRTLLKVSGEALMGSASYGIDTDTVTRVALQIKSAQNEGVEIASSLAHGAVSAIEEQVTNGVAVRMALLYRMLTGQEGEGLS